MRCAAALKSNKQEVSRTTDAEASGTKEKRA
jgi:hypothetical protein